MVFQPPAELEELSSFGEVVSWAISAWAPVDGPRSLRDLSDAGLVRESNTVAVGADDIAANNHAKWYVLLGQTNLTSFHELSRQRDRSSRSAETEASKVTRRWFEVSGTGMEKVEHLCRGLQLPAEVAEWVRNRRRHSRKSVPQFRPTAVAAALSATRDLVRDHQIYTGWLSRLRSALSAPAPWQPTWAEDIPRIALPQLTRRPLTVLTGDMGSGKSRYLRQQLARYVDASRPAGAVRPVLPVVLDAEHVSDVVADPDPWACAIQAFVTDYSPGIDHTDRERLARHLLSRSRDGDIGLIVACDGLDELPQTALMRLLDRRSGPIVRFLEAENASVVLSVRSGTDAGRLVSAFTHAVIGEDQRPITVGALKRSELASLARAWRVPLSAERLDQLLSRYPTALLAACALAAGAVDQSDSMLLWSTVQRLLGAEWKPGIDLTQASADTALAAAAELAFAMAADKTGWKYSASAAWARGRISATAGEAALTVVDRLLPRLLQRHSHDVTWVHAAVQEYLVGWHLANGVTENEATDFLRRRWWQHAQWHRVTVHMVASKAGPDALLALLAHEAGTDPFGVLDQLLLDCATVAVVPDEARSAALVRLQAQAKAMGPILGRTDSGRHWTGDGLKSLPERFRSLGPEGFNGFVAADYLSPLPAISLHQSDGNPVKHRMTPLFLPAVHVGAPIATRLARRCLGLLHPFIALTDSARLAELVSAAARWLDISELVVLTDTSRDQPQLDEDARFLISSELWARGVPATVARLPRKPDGDLLMTNLGPIATASLLTATCHHPDSVGVCRQPELVSGAEDTIERCSTDSLVLLLRERSITEPVRVAAALELMRRGAVIAPESVTKESIAQALEHRCRWGGPGRNQAIDLLDELLGDPRFEWADDLLSGVTSVRAVLALARNGRHEAARDGFDRVLSASSEYGLGLLPLLEADLSLSDSDIVEILKRTHHSGDGADDRDREFIDRALRRIGPEARRAVWEYAAPNGYVRMYVEAGYVLERRMLHEVMTLEELREAVRSARTVDRAMELLRPILLISLQDARTLANEIAAERWESHLTSCGAHMTCHLFTGLSELFPPLVQEQVRVHGDGLKLIAAGRYALIQDWRPRRTWLGATESYLPVARALAEASRSDANARAQLVPLALDDDEYEQALVEVDQTAGRSIMESRVASGAVAMDSNRAYDMLEVGSQLAIDWYVNDLSGPTGRTRYWPGVDVLPKTALAILRSLLAAWLSAATADAQEKLAIALYDGWHRWGESLTVNDVEDFRRTLAPHARELTRSLTGLSVSHP